MHHNTRRDLEDAILELRTLCAALRACDPEHERTETSSLVYTFEASADRVHRAFEADILSRNTNPEKQQ